MGIKMPREVEKIISLLDNGYSEAYIVGGCVRDSILRREPNDWDICTSAIPEVVMEIAEDNEIKVVPTGLKHGTVTLVMDEGSYEVTTFRNEGDYSDGRHPDKVEFVLNLEEDLKRRDFTMNAMAYNERVGLVDPFGGMEDLARLIVRCVGNPYERFEEDHLRMLRAIRFAATYGFKIDSWTDFALRDRFQRIEDVSKERINSEFCKILKSEHPDVYLSEYREEIAFIIPELKPCFGFKQNNPYHSYDVYTHTMYALRACAGKSLEVKLAVLLHDIGKPRCYSEENGIGHFYGRAKVSAEMANEILTRLRFDNKTVHDVVELVENHDRVLEENKRSVRKLVQKLGVGQTLNLFDVREADVYGHNPKTHKASLDKMNSCKGFLAQIIMEDECTQIKDLQINGRDIMALGVPEGRLVGDVLNHLLEMVVDERLENEKAQLLYEAIDYIKSK